MGQVFISYSHDDNPHQERVHSLAERLRADGINVIIDRDRLPGGPPEGWPMWSEAQVRNTERVLVVCSAAYRRRYDGKEAPGTGLGSVWEARAIHQALYDTGGINERFRVVLVAEDDSGEIPEQLKAYHRFPVFRQAGYQELLAWLQGRGGGVAVPVTGKPGIAWPTPPADHDWQIADRKDVFARFQAMITGRSERRILLLEGVSNTGKTVLSSQLCGYAGRLGLATAALDIKGCPGLDELFGSLRLDLGPEILAESHGATGSGRFFSLISDLQQLCSPLLLLFDTYEQASADAQKWLESQLLPRLDRAPAVVVAIGGQRIPERAKYPWGTNAEVHRLEPIDRVEDWIEFCRRKWRCEHVSPDHIEALTLSTGGDPGQIYALLESLVQAKLAAHGA